MAHHPFDDPKADELRSSLDKIGSLLGEMMAKRLAEIFPQARDAVAICERVLDEDGIRDMRALAEAEGFEFIRGAIFGRLTTMMAYAERTEDMLQQFISEDFRTYLRGKLGMA